MKKLGWIQIAILILFVVAAKAHGDVGPAPVEVSCIGNDDAQGFVIYLHGMDSSNPSPQEIKNRVILAKVASKFNLKIALPRAQLQCPTQAGSICWGWAWNSTELSSALTLAMDSRSKCFSKDRPFGVLGFSNGGYLLTHWFQAGLLPSLGVRPAFIIASGSEHGSVQTPLDLNKNPPLVLIAGNLDTYNYDPNKSYANQLTAMHANVDVITFSGGHELDEISLKKALLSFFP